MTAPFPRSLWPFGPDDLGPRFGIRGHTPTPGPEALGRAEAETLRGFRRVGQRVGRCTRRRVVLRFPGRRCSGIGRPKVVRHARAKFIRGADTSESSLRRFSIWQSVALFPMQRRLPSRLEIECFDMLLGRFSRPCFYWSPYPPKPKSQAPHQDRHRSMQGRISCG